MTWKNLKGTLESLFQFGLAGVGLRSNSGVLEARNPANTAYASVRCLNAQLDGELITPTLSGWVSGCQLANNTTDAVNDINFSSGAAFIGDRLVSLTARTKRLDAAWASGTNQGGLFSGSKASNTTYHCFAMRNTSTGAVDFGFDTSPTGSNKPVGWEIARVMAIMTDGDGAIRRFLQQNNFVQWLSHNLDIYASSIDNSPTNYTISVPTGVRVAAHTSLWFGGGSNFVYIYVASPEALSLGANYITGQITAQSGAIAPGSVLRILTNINGQISICADSVSVDDVLWLSTTGFEFFR